MPTIRARRREGRRKKRCRISWPKSGLFGCHRPGVALASPIVVPPMVASPVEKRRRVRKMRQSASRRRNSSITSLVRGEIPSHIRKDSAACSTNIPKPSVAIAAPCPRPHSTKGVGFEE